MPTAICIGPPDNALRALRAAGVWDRSAPWQPGHHPISTNDSPTVSVLTDVRSSGLATIRRAARLHMVRYQFVREGIPGYLVHEMPCDDPARQYGVSIEPDAFSRRSSRQFVCRPRLAIVVPCRSSISFRTKRSNGVGVRKTHRPGAGFGVVQDDGRTAADDGYRCTDLGLWREMGAPCGQPYYNPHFSVLRSFLRAMGMAHEDRARRCAAD